MDTCKIEVIKSAPILVKTTEIRSFLGLAGYYRRFIRNFAEISARLHAATPGSKRFEWTEEMQAAFEYLKEKLKTPLVLSFPKFGEPLFVETDASYVSLGALLDRKKEDWRIYPMQYAVRTMKSAERNYPACEREAMAVVFALKKFRIYLPSSKPAGLLNDHQALQYAFQKKDVYGRLAHWLDILAKCEFKI